MTVIVPPGYGAAAIEMKHSSDPDPWFVTFGVDINGPADGQAAANEVFAAWKASIGLQLSSDVTSVACNLRIGQDGPTDGEFRSVLSPAAGTSSAAMLPQNCAALYRKLTGLAGRRNRGRFFVPGILREGGVNAVGAIDSGDVADLQLQADAFLTQLDSRGVPMVILHSSGTGSGAPTPVSALQVDRVISTQRRRLR